MTHVRSGTRLTQDTIAFLLGCQGAPHRILAAKPHEQAYRRKDAIEDHSEENSGVDPPQDLTHLHPDAIDLPKAAWQDERQDHQHPSQDEGPQPWRLPPPDCRPQADEG